MKKVLSLLLALSILFLVSCGEKTELLTPEEKLAYREENPYLFPNAACDHYLQYGMASKVDRDADSNLYHSVSCKWGNCDYESHLEPHTIQPEKIKRLEYAFTKPDGNFYHAVHLVCPKCKQEFVIYLYCPVQDSKCNTPKGKPCPLLALEDWGEYLCDTPYVISGD